MSSCGGSCRAKIGARECMWERGGRKPHYTSSMSLAAPALPRKKLPVGIQNLREIREQGHYYVDKSGLAIDLLNSGKYFFLSRPRRFGKSLLVDTFKELFEGNRALFEAFPYGEALNNILRKTGFIDVVAMPQTFGVATIYSASKK